jgi:hypothetical protein
MLLRRKQETIIRILFKITVPEYLHIAITATATLNVGKSTQYIS